MVFFSILIKKYFEYFSISSLSYFTSYCGSWHSVFSMRGGLNIEAYAGGCIGPHSKGAPNHPEKKNICIISVVSVKVSGVYGKITRTHGIFYRVRKRKYLVLTIYFLMRMSQLP